MGDRLPVGGYGKQIASGGPDTVLIYIKTFKLLSLVNHLLWLRQAPMLSDLVSVKIGKITVGFIQISLHCVHQP